jgi:hypothetical protein
MSGAREWTTREDYVIRKYYPAGGSAACLPHLPSDRNHKAVWCRASRIGVKKIDGGGSPFGTGTKNPNGKISNEHAAIIRLRHNQIWPGLTAEQKAAILGITVRHFRRIVNENSRKYAVLEAA